MQSVIETTEWLKYPHIAVRNGNTAKYFRKQKLNIFLHMHDQAIPAHAFVPKK